MSEQTVEQVAAKVDRSNNYVNCKLGYDSLIVSIKSFVHHFNTLSDDEKTEFKSLNSHVKLLDKCLEVVRNNTNVKTAQKYIENRAKLANKEEVVAEPVKSKKRGSKKEESPTAQAVKAAPAVAEPVEAAADKKSTKKSASKAK